MKTNLAAWKAVFLLGLAPSLGFAVTPGTISVETTYDHISVRWNISNDDDLDSVMGLEYRLIGAPEYQAAAPAMRAFPDWIVDGEQLGLDYWAASAMFLQAGSGYELRITLTDPDGGSSVQTRTATTRIVPRPSTEGRDLCVVPGNGGGTGDCTDPFRGLQDAAEDARPGDVFHVAAGTYGPFELLKSGTALKPITFIGDPDGGTVIDGAGTERGIVTLGEQQLQPVITSHVIFTGFTIQNGAWGIDAQHTQDILISRNLIQDVESGILNRRGSGLEGRQTICDNVILGRTTWPGEGIPETEGIDLRGSGNVVCYNDVRKFGDCISVSPTSGLSNGNDVFGNEISECVDDGLEIDYNQSNVRVWRNRITNARMGISAQPVRGGPAYILRNEIFNTQDSPIKMHNGTTGMLVVHNTSVKHGNGQGDEGAMWRNVFFRNNFFLGTAYAFEFTTVPDEGVRDFDYDAWGTNRAIGGSQEPHFKWDNQRFNRLPNLQDFGQEVHGVEARFEHLQNAVLGSSYTELIKPGTRDLRLVTLVAARNSGLNLLNVNGPFVQDGQPDMGAFEAGQPLPSYGPRPIINLSASLGLTTIALGLTGMALVFRRRSGARRTPGARF